jgi:phage gpG-like protein
MLQLEIDDHLFVAELEGLKHKLDYMPSNEIAKLILQGIHQTFDDAGASDAVIEDHTVDFEWAERQEEGDGHPLLIDSGGLYNSFFYNITKEDNDVMIDFESGMPYAGFLNNGTKFMPPRPFFLVRETTLQDIEEILAKHFVS